MNLGDIPLLNACLNSCSFISLICGYVQIRKGNQVGHQKSMIAALIFSAAFLAFYLYYHFHAGRTTFVEPSWFRPYYLVILVTHTILAMLIVPMVITTVWFAIQKKFEQHKRLARVTLPIWLYVSFTGVVIYFLLYVIFPQVK